MGRVGMVLDLVAEFVMGRVCQGPSLSWAEFVMGRDVPESYLRTTFPALLTGGLHLFRCMSMFPVGRFDSLGGQTGIVGSCCSPLWDVKPKQTFSFAGPERIGLYCN